MKYLKSFSRHSQYEDYLNRSSSVFPNVSVCDDEPGVVHYNLTKPIPSDAIDLGLISGTLWCSHNIGAATETDNGDYFMWGSTSPDTNNTCDWAHAPFNNGKSNFDTEYFNTYRSEWLDGDDALKPEYDAAHVIMGGNWRMPTKADCDELLSGTTNVWVTNYKGSGKNGRLFTSKTNGNTMFIPTAGYRNGSSFNDRGDYGNVWSSLLLTDFPNFAWGLNFGSGNCDMYNCGRCYGFSVRSIMKP